MAENDDGLFDGGLAAACSLNWVSSIATWRSSSVSSAAWRLPAKSHRTAPPRRLRLDRFLFFARPPSKPRKASRYW